MADGWINDDFHHVKCACTTLPKTNISPLKIVSFPKRKRSSSNHQFSGAMLVSGRVVRYMDPMRLVFFSPSNVHLMYPQHYPGSLVRCKPHCSFAFFSFLVLKSWNPFQTGFRILITPPKINMEPGNDGFQ